VIKASPEQSLAMDCRRFCQQETPDGGNSCRREIADRPFFIGQDVKRGKSASETLVCSALLD